VIVAGKAFNVKAIAQVQESRGREGGLAPLFLRLTLFCAKTFAVMGEIIREKNLTDYQIVTNGPGYQTVSYLHFHLVARRSR
jgi:hypothetical protein